MYLYWLLILSSLFFYSCSNSSTCFQSSDCQQPLVCLEKRCVPKQETGLEKTQEKKNETLKESTKETLPEEKQQEKEVLLQERQQEELVLEKDGGWSNSLIDKDFQEYLPSSKEKKASKWLEHSCTQTNGCCLPVEKKQINAFSGKSGAKGYISVAVSPDAKWMASASDSGNIIRLWNLAQKKLARVLYGHTQSVRALAFSHDSLSLVSASSDKKILLWDVVSGVQKSVFSGHTNSINAVSFSKDDHLLLSCGTDRNLLLWQVQDQKIVATLKGHTSDVSACQWSSDQKTVYSASYDNSVRAWDVATQKETQNWNVHTRSVYSLHISPDNRYLVTGSSDQYSKIIDLQTNLVIRTLGPHLQSVYAVQFSPDNRFLATISSKEVKIWDTSNWSIKHDITSSTSWSDSWHSIQFHPDNSKVWVSHRNEQTIRAWDVQTGKEESQIFSFFDENVDVVVSSDASHLFQASVVSDSIYVWKRNSALPPEKWSKAHQETKVLSLDASKDGKYLLSGGLDSKVTLWNIAKKSVQQELVGHTMPVTAVKYSPDGTLIASTGWDGQLILWDANSGQIKDSLELHPSEGYGLSFHSTKDWIASGGKDGKVRVYDFQQKKIIAEIQVDSSAVLDVVFHSSENMLAVSTWSGKTIFLSTVVWDISFEAFVSTSPARKIQFHPSLPYLAIASFNNKVTLWNWKEKKIFRDFTTYLSPPSGLSFSQDGGLLAVSTWSESIEVLSLLPFQPKERKTRKKGGFWQLSLSSSHLFLTSNDANEMEIRNKSTQEILAKLPISETIFSFSLSSSGKYVAVATEKEIWIWDLAQQKIQKTKFSLNVSPTSMIFSLDETTLFLGNKSGYLQWLQVKTGQISHQKRFASQVTSLAVSKQTLAVGFQNGEIRLLDLSGTEKALLSSHSLGVFQLYFAKKTPLLYSLGFDKQVIQWDLTSYLNVDSFAHSSQWIRGFALNHQENKLVLLLDSQKAVIQSVSDHQLENVLEHQEDLTFAFFSVQDDQLFVFSEQGTLSTWLLSIDPKTEFYYRNPWSSMDVASSDQDGKLLVGSANSSIRFYHHTLRFNRTVWDQRHSAKQLKISTDGTLLYSIDEKEILELVLATGKVNAKFKGHLQEIVQLDLHPKHPLLASFSNDHEVKIWDTSKASEMHSKKWSQSIVRISFHPERKELMVLLSNSNLLFWNLDTQKERWMQFPQKIENVQWHPKGKAYVVLTQNNTLRFYEDNTSLFFEEKVLPAFPKQLTFHPLGLWLGILYTTNRFEVLSLDTWDSVFVFHETNSPFFSFSWSEQGKTLQMGNEEGVVNFFQCAE